MYVILLLILLFSGAYRPVNKQNPTHPKTNHTQSKLSNPTPTPTPDASVQQPNSIQSGNNSNTPADDRTYKVKVKEAPPDYWMRAYVIVNGLVAIFSLGTLLYIRHQRDVMRDQLQAMRDQLTEMKTGREQTIAEMQAAGKQTDKTIKHLETQVGHLNTLADAAKESAAAAKLTADRFAQNEGARIIVNLDWALGGGRFYLSGTGGDATGLPLTITCTNEGKSLGWITEIRLTAEIFHNTIPENPNFEIDILHHGVEPIPAKTGEFKKQESITVIGHDGIGQWIVIWGIVKYSDPFSDNRETTFGFTVRADGKLIRIALSAYNRHT